MPDDLILDPWTPLAYKQVFGDPTTNTPGAFRNAPWLTSTDRRRLSAYIVLGAYAENAARDFLPLDNDRREQTREYGDAALLVEQGLSALLGESQQIVVDRADEYDPKTMGPDTDRDGAADSAPARPATAETPELSPQEVEDILTAAASQERLVEWADAENFLLTVLSGERDAVTLGDAVYIVSWDAEKGRVRVMNVDPGLYFPSQPSSSALSPDQYPDRVDFLWSTPDDESWSPGERHETVTRVTYWLGPILPVIDEQTGQYAVDGDGAMIAPEGTRWEEKPGTGYTRLVRDVPWSDEPVEETCYLDVTMWRAADIGQMPNGGGVAAIPVTEKARRIVSARDLMIDFLPVVHVPNTWPGAHVFGQSLLTKVTQALDDLQNADTDTQAAASTTGSPIIAVSGGTVVAQRNGTGPGRDMGNVPTFDVQPGMVLSLGADGSLSTVDTSAQLREMRAYTEDLRGRVTQNARIPDVALGLVGEAANSMSGTAIELRYGPMQSLIRGMRQVRAAKYPVLLRFVQRFMMLEEGYDGPRETPRAQIAFGTFMPRDLQGALQRVGEAYRAGVISLDTAVMLLQQAGMPIEDVAAEVSKIERRDYTRATALADATGDQQAVRDFLGLEPRTIIPAAGVTTLPATGARPAAPAATDDDEA